MPAPVDEEGRRARDAAEIGAVDVLGDVPGARMLLQVVPEPLHESAEMPGAALNILARVEDIPDAEHRGGLRHQLHQALCAPAGHRAGIESRLGPDDGPDEALRHGVTSRSVVDVSSVGAMIAAGLREVHEAVRRDEAVGLRAGRWRDRGYAQDRQEHHVAVHARLSGQVRYRIRTPTDSGTSADFGHKRLVND